MHKIFATGHQAKINLNRHIWSYYVPNSTTLCVYTNTSNTSYLNLVSLPVICLFCTTFFLSEHGGVGWYYFRIPMILFIILLLTSPSSQQEEYLIFIFSYLSVEASSFWPLGVKSPISPSNIERRPTRTKNSAFDVIVNFNLPTNCKKGIIWWERNILRPFCANIYLSMRLHSTLRVNALHSILV